MLERWWGSRRSVSGGPGFVRRFLREVRLVANLDSPHVVQVLEVGDESAPIPYLAMEHLEGTDMKRVLVKVVGQMPVRPTRLAAVHRDVEAFFAIALAKDPDDRFDDAATLHTSLASARAGELADTHRQRAAALLAERLWAN